MARYKTGGGYDYPVVNGNWGWVINLTISGQGSRILQRVVMDIKVVYKQYDNTGIVPLGEYTTSPRSSWRTEANDPVSIVLVDQARFHSTPFTLTRGVGYNFDEEMKVRLLDKMLDQGHEIKNILEFYPELVELAIERNLIEESEVPEPIDI